MFLLWAIAFNLHVTLSGETEHVALCFCSSRNKAQKCFESFVSKQSNAILKPTDNFYYSY